MDHVVLACDQRDFAESLQLAQQVGAGLEIQTFAYPEALDGDLDTQLAAYRERLAGFAGERTLHGAFIDMVSASIDSKIAAVTEQRYLQSLHVARTLGAHLIVFHLNFLTHIRTEDFRRQWTQRQVVFWKRLGQRAADSGLDVALENMWEWEPSIIQAVLDGVDQPHVKACLDVGHAHLYSSVPLADWLAALGEHLTYIHMNNNSGRDDQHRALDDGVLDYGAILDQLRGLPQPLTYSLEMPGTETKQRSLRFFDLGNGA
jgi:sugar phosphate isomerase/epimerase